MRSDGAAAWRAGGHSKALARTLQRCIQRILQSNAVRAGGLYLKLNDLPQVPEAEQR